MKENIMLAVFGDSFVAEETYQNNSGETWPNILKGCSLSTVDEVVQYAAGGAVSGREYGYALNGQTLPTPGLLTQVDEFVDSINNQTQSLPNRITIHVGTNDIVIGSGLYPFIGNDGNTMDASDESKNTRAAFPISDIDFATMLMNNYTAGNITSAYIRLKQYAPVIVVGPVDVSLSGLALTFSEYQQEVAKTASYTLEAALKLAISSNDYVSVIDNHSLTLLDEIHPNYKWHRTVAGLVATL